MRPPLDPPPGRGAAAGLAGTVIWALLALVAIGIVQMREGVYSSELATHSDEAAHFVTALSLLDYVRTGLGTNPIEFAESYYVQYPKVALGHWPPGFHLLQAGWYALVGGTPTTGLFLVGLISALAVLVLVLWLHRLYGPWIAGTSALVLLSLPAVREASASLMADMLTALFVLLALQAYAGWSAIGSASIRRFALWSAAAIATKASAAILLPFALLGLPAVGRTGGLAMTRRQALAVFGVLLVVTVGILGLPHLANLRGLPSLEAMPAFADRTAYVTAFARTAPPAVWALAAVGVLVALVGHRTDRRQAAPLRLTALLVAVWVVSQVAVRDIIEDRYFLPALFPVMLLFGAGTDAVMRAVQTQTVLTNRLAPAASSILAAALLVAIAVVSVVGAPATTTIRRTGYADAARLAAGPVILVSSDPSGEGAFIADALAIDATRQRVVLRASKLLAASDWMGNRYIQGVSATADVRELLDAVPVHFIALDGHGLADERSRPHHRVLERTVREHPEQFRPVERGFVDVTPLARQVPLVVYENIRARGRRPDVVRVPMGPDLERTFELRLTGPRPLPRRPDASAERDAWVGERIAALARGVAERLPPARPPSAPFRIQPRSDASDDGFGGGGQILVTTSPNQEWTVSGVPPWIALTPPLRHTGSGAVSYLIAQNDTSAPRTADLTIGDARYRISQPVAPFVRLPLVDRFVARPSRWTLEDKTGRANLEFSSDAARGTGTMVLTTSGTKGDPHEVQVYLPEIEFRGAADYDVSVRLRAERPADVWLALEQRHAPYGPCGLWQPVRVTTDWTTATARFTTAASGCGPETNRLTIVSGSVSGRLWIADFSLRPAAD